MKLNCGGKLLDLGQPVVMGVLNVTPDSFSDGGQWEDHGSAVRRASEMVEQGAQIIDIGGESTRPGSDAVPVDEELQRVIPVIEQLAGNVDAVISVDTRKAEVMRAAWATGAGMINDVAALSEPDALQTAADSGAALCLMHMQGRPKDMQVEPQYEDVVAEVRDFLTRRVEACLDVGISADRLVVDPGFGFGKTLSHNYQLLAGLERIAVKGLPLLVGMSRKSMLGAVLDVPPAERIHGGIAAAVMAMERGSRIIRTHDVLATCHAVQVFNACQEQGDSGTSDGQQVNFA